MNKDESANKNKFGRIWSNLESESEDTRKKLKLMDYAVNSAVSKYGDPLYTWGANIKALAFPALIISYLFGISLWIVVGIYFAAETVKQAGYFLKLFHKSKQETGIDQLFS